MAEWLLEHPDPPVAVIRRSDPTRRVLVYVDGTSDATRAVSCAAELPWLATCEVRVVALRGQGRYGGEAVQDAVARLQGAGADPIVQRAHAPAWLSTAEKARVVLKEIEAFDPDLIVVGLKAHRSLARAFRATGPTKSTWSVLVAVARDGTAADRE
ncbi:MAG: universal stress protein [Candidatus Nanopelagicales bacterium]